jgi:hypothetical protein
VLGACKAARREWTAALGYLQAAYLGGFVDPFCLRWLAFTLLSNGQIEAAKPVLRQWEQLQPENVEVRAYLAALAKRESGQEAAPEARPERTDPQGRRLRVDLPPSVLAVPSLAPIVSQTMSTDTPTHPV